MYKTPPSARSSFQQRQEIFDRERIAQEAQLRADREPSGMATTLNYIVAQNNIPSSSTSAAYKVDQQGATSVGTTADKTANVRHTLPKNDHDPQSTPARGVAPRAPTTAGVETPSQLEQNVQESLVPGQIHNDESPIGGETDAHKQTHATGRNPAVLDIANHPQSELVLMLASLLGKITASNDTLHNGPNAIMPPRSGTPLLAFHARNIPSISIQAYLARILKYCPMSSDIFLSLLVYFDRMSKLRSETSLGKDDDPATAADPHPANRAFTSTRQIMGVEGADAHPFSVDSFNVHRLVITGIVVASKFCSDVFYTNSRYAKVGGLPLSELNHLEFQFLLMNDFRLMIPLEELQRYGDQLLHFWLKESASETGTASDTVT